MIELPDCPLAFVDLETTGATAGTDRITEIGIVTINNGQISEWSQLVQPEQPISDFIQNLTGISNAMVADAPRFAEIADDVLARLSGHAFIAHNARFDFGFLRHEFSRLGIEFRATVVCTVKLSRKLYPEHYKHNLDSLIERHSLVMESRHRALADARAISQFWQIARREKTPEEFASALKHLTSYPAVPKQIDPQVVDDLPEKHGVYVLYGENDLPLYVGKSNTLKKRVLAHFAADHKAAKNNSLSQQVRRLEGIACSGEVGALLTEARLIKQLQPSMNRQRRSNDACTWQLRELSPGHWQPELLALSALNRTPQAHLYGLFQNPREARAKLAELAKLNGLCPVVLGLDASPQGKACFAHQSKQCKGACCGVESLLAHSARLLSVLTKTKLMPWPFNGPATLREGESLHVIDHWHYLGSARNEEDVFSLLEDRSSQFDRDTYRALLKVLPEMRAIPQATGQLSRTSAV